MATTTAEQQQQQQHDDGVDALVPLRTHICLPGDVVLRLQPHAVVSVGGGLRAVTCRKQPANASSDAHRATTVLLAEYCAPLQRHSHPLVAHIPHFTIESPASRRYVYRAGDPVVAIVLRTLGQQYYECYTAAATPALLDAVAFDGASKSNRPRLTEGDVLYSHVRARGHANNNKSSSSGGGGADRGMYASEDAELSCCAGEVGLPAKDWTSGEAVFGVLHGGRVLHVSLSYARSLLAPLPPHLLAAVTASTWTRSRSRRKRPRAATAAVDAAEDDDGSSSSSAATRTPHVRGDEVAPASLLLALLGQCVSFDVCVGVNGLVWVRSAPVGAASATAAAAAVRRTIAVCACLVEGQADDTYDEMCARVQRYFAPA